MPPLVSQVVQEVVDQLREHGLIDRGHHLVNSTLALDSTLFTNNTTASTTTAVVQVPVAVANAPSSKPGPDFDFGDTLWFMLKLFPLLLLGTVLTMALFGAALAARLTAFHFVGIFHDRLEAKQHLDTTGGRGGRDLEIQAVESQEATSTIGSEPTSLSLEAFEVARPVAGMTRLGSNVSNAAMRSVVFDQEDGCSTPDSDDNVDDVIWSTDDNAEKAALVGSSAARE
jgi:hypothetical protein